MGIHQLNHAVLYVRDVERSVSFYADVLGFSRANDIGIPGAAFLTAPDSRNDHDLGLFEVGTEAADSNAGRRGVGLYHLAWEVQTLADLRDIAVRLQQVGALRGASDHGTSKSLYGRDPDGLEFEVVWLVPADRITPEVLDARRRIVLLDLEAEIARYGADTLGGLGISRPAVT